MVRRCPTPSYVCRGRRRRIPSEPGGAAAENPIPPARSRSAVPRRCAHVAERCARFAREKRRRGDDRLAAACGGASDRRVDHMSARARAAAIELYAAIGKVASSPSSPGDDARSRDGQSPEVPRDLRRLWQHLEFCRSPGCRHNGSRTRIQRRGGWWRGSRPHGGSWLPRRIRARDGGTASPPIGRAGAAALAVCLHRCDQIQ